VSHMDIDSEEKEASKDDRIYPCSLFVHTGRGHHGFMILCRMKISMEILVILLGREN
jgi:hypothetical protein